MTDSNSKGEKLSEILADLKAEYRRNFPRKLQKLYDALVQGDFVELREEFHKLKGTGQTYGYPEVSLVCETMEHLCTEGEPELRVVRSSLDLLDRMQMEWALGRNYDLQSDDEARKILALGKGPRR